MKFTSLLAFGSQRSRTLVLLCFGLFCSAQTALPMSVLPPSFPELVSEAGAIAKGKVIAVEPFETVASTGESVIKTRVTWATESTLKGNGQETVSLEFFGGRIGERKMEISGMPTFQVGEMNVIFVSKQRKSLCPLVGAGYGRYRVVLDEFTQTERVLRQDGSPLLAVTSVPQPISEHVSLAGSVQVSQALSTDQFFQAIRQELARNSAPAESSAK